MTNKINGLVGKVSKIVGGYRLLKLLRGLVLDGESSVDWVSTEGTLKEGKIIGAADKLEIGLHLLELLGNLKSLGLHLVASLVEEVAERLDVSLGEGNVALLLNLQTLLVPVGLEEGLAGELSADLGIVDGLALVVPVGHHVKDNLERRAGIMDRSVLPVIQSGLLLGLGKVLNTIGVNGKVLELRLEHLLGEDDRRVVEHASKEFPDELLGDAPAEAGGGDIATLELKVLDTLQEAVLDHVLWLALLGLHTTPELGDDHTDVVLDLELGSNPASGTAEAAISCEDHRHHAVVEIGTSHDGIEGALGKSALRSSTCRGRALASDGADVVHEKLRDLLVVDGVEDAKRSDLHAIEDIGRVVAATTDDGTNGEIVRVGGGNLAVKSAAELSQVLVLWLGNIGTKLQVARILGRLALPDTRLGTADTDGTLLVDALVDVALHVISEEFVEVDFVLDVGDLLGVNRLEVTTEQALAGHIPLCLFVIPWENGIIGALEEPPLAVLTELEAGVGVVLSSRQTADHVARYNDGGGDIILHLNLIGRDEVLAKLVGTPITGVLIKTDTKEGSDQSTVINLELMARSAIDLVNGEVRAPITIPLWLIEPLDGKNDGTDVVGNV